MEGEQAGQADTEFIELKNMSSDTMELSDIQFSTGIQFTFPSMTLAPGESVLVVQDRRAFSSFYGTGHPIAGEYTGRLSNSGERLVLKKMPWIK